MVSFFRGRLVPISSKSGVESMSFSFMLHVAFPKFKEAR
jgi:hypothetical protein